MHGTYFTDDENEASQRFFSNTVKITQLIGEEPSTRSYCPTVPKPVLSIRTSCHLPNILATKERPNNLRLTESKHVFVGKECI